MLTQTLDPQAVAQAELEAHLEAQVSVIAPESVEAHRGSGRTQRFFDLSMSLKRKADALYQIHQAGQQCFEQWLQLERAAARARWLWMAYEFSSTEYMTSYHASISI